MPTRQKRPSEPTRDAIRCVRLLLLVLLISAGLLPVGRENLRGDEPPVAAPDAAEEALELADLVLQYHVNPPTRQEMVLTAAKSLYRHAFQPVPGTLPRVISDAASRNSLLEVVRTAVNDYCNHAPASALDWQRGNPRITDRQRAEESARDVIRQAIMAVIQGEPSITTAAGQQVAAQLDSNRYVGIGIKLQLSGDLPLLLDVVEGGPAEISGALAGDQIVRIDGHDTQGLPLQDVMSLLRGAEGSIVSLRLRQPGKEARDVVITRGVVPLKTLEQYRLHRAEGEPTIGYLYVTRIAASTVHELDQLRSTLSADGVQGLILDLRGRRQASLHNAILLADALLDGGTIGKVHYADREDTCTAAPEDVFAGLPLAVLVDGNTGDVSEWLAAALQDNQRALIVGVHTSGVAFVNSAFPLADGSHTLQLATAILARGNDRPLLRPERGTTPELELRHATIALPGRGNGEAIQQKPTLPWGVTPDLEVESDKLNGFDPELFHSGRVVQAAVERLRKQLRDQPTARE